jgi:hypothetical protein
MLEEITLSLAVCWEYWQGGGYTTLPLSWVSDFNDGQWHSHELRIKLNSSGSASDGILEYWLDGVKKATHVNVSFGDISNMAIHRFGVGIGNVSDSPWYQAQWSAIAFDDVVVSTEYIGPDKDDAPSIPGDINKDGVVNIFDYNIFLQHFGVVEDCLNSADLNGDCSVNIFDYNILLQNFGRTQ